MQQEKIDIKTPEYVSLQFQTAGLGSRAAAFLIDQALLMAFNIAVVLIVLLSLGAGFEVWLIRYTESYVLGFLIIGLFVVNWGYFFVYEFFSGGRTLGKKLLGIRVMQENGHSITLLSSLIRNLIRIIDMLPAFYFIGIVMIFFHKQHKRLGDLVAGTIVIHERKVKKGKKSSPLETEMKNRGVSKETLALDDWTIKSFSAKDWKLINTYAARFLQLPKNEKTELTKQVAAILLTKAGVEWHTQTEAELENNLLAIYLHLKEEWEFEM
ncbi:RDD family protein [Neobacillus sp. SCS-31]|uniref:RDD family protein n=1 Tax=Neobacillus oceani TaxID=3115292 RepID=UPI003905DDF5